MKQLINVQARVLDILTYYPATRGNDMLLYLKFAEMIEYEFKTNILNRTFSEVIANMEEFHLPSFGSVGRARRKVQELLPELKPDETVQGFRAELETEYREYSKTGMSEEAREARNAYHREYRKKNRDKIFLNNKRRRMNNPEKFDEYERTYWENVARKKTEGENNG